MKNSLLRVLTHLLSPREREKTERFLVVSTTGLGDTLWATPALRSLRAQFPNSYIAVLTSPVGREVLRANPAIDEFFSFKNLFTLRTRNIRTALLFHASQRMALPFAVLSGATRRIGTYGLNKGLDDLLTHALVPCYTHEIARRLDIVAQVGAVAHDPAMALYLDEADEETMLRFLAEKKIDPDTPLIGLHPGAQNLFKQWGAEGFAALGTRLAKELGAQVVLTGTPQEMPLLKNIQAQIPGAVIAQLPLRPCAALIRHMRLLICNDTGPFHVALALKTKVVALFGPTDPALCGPYQVGSEHYRLLRALPTCSPCLKKKCQDPFCLLQISPQAVYDAALQLVEHANPQSPFHLRSG